MNSVEFTEKILGQVSDYVAQSECVDKDRIAKYLEVIIEKKCPEEEMPDIVDEINQIDSTDFAVWVLYGYCEIKKEMLERIPQIDFNILIKCNSNVGRILVSDYLLQHSYYDCDLKVLELYLKIMRDILHPSEGEIAAYLSILDKYAKDNISIKYKEIGTYNYLLSLYLFYMAVKLSEQREVDKILLQETMNFMVNLLKCLQMSGMKRIVENSNFSYLFEENERITRSQEADNLVIEKFIYMDPVISEKGEIHLSEDYYYMILYMYSYPDVCASLIRQNDKDNIEIIKQKHLLYLMNILLDRTQINGVGFDRKSLYRVRDILRERYNVKY